MSAPESTLVPEKEIPLVFKLKTWYGDPRKDNSSKRDRSETRRMGKGGLPVSGRELFPEDILTATLCVVGDAVRLIDDERLAEIFDKAAQNWPLFGKFRKHPQYNYSKLLSETLQTLDLGGSIVRDNAPLQYFRVSKHLSGKYGKAKLASLQADEAKAVHQVADEILSVFS